MSHKPGDDSGSVERYYERNTRAFLRFGGGGNSSIHRQLWGPGVRTAADASQTINRLLVDEIRGSPVSPAPVILDLGCGVGGTALHIAAELDAAVVHGISISPSQIRIAEAAGEAAGLDGRCHFQCADFEAATLGIQADFVLAIEASVHSRDPSRFFRTAFNHMRPGATLVVVDDYLAASVDDGLAERLSNAHGPVDADRKRLRAQHASAARLAERFRRGWRAPSLQTVAERAAIAGRAGLVVTADRDLTPLIRLTRPRDRLVALAAPVCRLPGLKALPYCGNLSGGHALTTGLRAGVFQYRWLQYRRPA